MKELLRSFRRKLGGAILGPDLRRLLARIDTALVVGEQKTAERDRQMEFVLRRLSAQLELSRAERDDIEALSTKLVALRGTPEYQRAMDEDEPLISVRIASYRRTEELMDVAIASVRAQSYQNFEVIVVNDGPNAKTRHALKALGDARIRYEEFDQRSAYPGDGHARWMVAGSPGMNRGADLARGNWIAPLDEDDCFTPDHIEKLLALAQSERVELAYGALIQKNRINGETHRIWSYPPKVSQFSFQGAIYLSLLNSIFRYDEASWLVEEPGDWNLIRRMSTAGVTMRATEDIVAVMNQIPYTHKAED